jgi:hypothetical protein
MALWPRHVAWALATVVALEISRETRWLAISHDRSKTWPIGLRGVRIRAR